MLASQSQSRRGAPLAQEPKPTGQLRGEGWGGGRPGWGRERGGGTRRAGKKRVEHAEDTMCAGARKHFNAELYAEYWAAREGGRVPEVFYPDGLGDTV